MMDRHLNIYAICQAENLTRIREVRMNFEQGTYEKLLPNFKLFNLHLEIEKKSIHEKSKNN